jgi:nucleoside-diphosphate-sugar epimerase
MAQKRGIGLKGDDIIDGLLAMGTKEEAVGEAINLGSGKEHRVIDMTNRVNELAGQTLGKFNHQTFKKGLI